MPHNKTIQCAQICSWTLQHLLFAPLPSKNHSALGADSKKLIQVIKKHHQSRCLLISKLILLLSEKANAYICLCTFLGCILGTMHTVNRVLFTVWCPKARSSLAVAWVKNASCSSRSHWLCPERSVNPLFFSHKSAERRNEDGPSSSSYALQNTDLHQCF